MSQYYRHIQISSKNGWDEEAGTVGLPWQGKDF
jgi:hypothetical protein